MLLKQREYSLKLEEQNQKLEQKNKELARWKTSSMRCLATENSTDMISRHKPDGTYLYVSPASEELIGYAPEELIGQNVFDNIHPVDNQRLRGKVKDFEDRKIERWEFRKQTKEGDYKWVEASIRPIGDEETGEIIEIQASTRDISGRKEYEQKLKEEKEFVDSAIHSMPELFFLVDEELNFVRWNNIDRELGYTDEEVRDMHPLDFFNEKNQSFVISKIYQAFNEGNAEAEMEMQHKDGHTVPYYVTAKQFRRGDRKFLVGSGVNLSDIKKAQFELQQNRQLLDAIINQTEAIIYVKDSKGRNRLVNESYCKLFNMEREDIIGKTDREVHDGVIADNVEKTDRRILETGEVIEVEEEILVDGEVRHDCRAVNVPGRCAGI
ncbi:MAG: PAS domain S-box protein [Fodinibius sp.]|nr:PAS domain S-box protein [Fodinibius sp.]